MPSYLTSVVLEFSEDPISDATPTWTDVTAYMRNLSYQVGVAREGSGPEPGSMTVLLRNTNRDWEPDYVAGRFYPNVTTQRRFRLTVNGVQWGVWYVQSFDISYPLNTAVSEVTVTCGDGSEVLALDNLPELDPPGAQSYSEVVGFGDPAGYWSLGEPAGTRARPNVVRGKRRVATSHGKVLRKFKERRGTRYSTKPEAGAVAGPSGTYKGNPLLGEPSLVLGDQDFSVKFDGVNDWVRIPFDDAADLIDSNRISLEAVVKPTTASGTAVIVGGPDQSGGSCFSIARVGAEWRMVVVDSGGNTTSAQGGVAAADTTYHIVGTWDGQIARIYVDGAEVDSTSDPRFIAGSGSLFAIGAQAPSSPVSFWTGWIDEAAVYETVLTPEQVLAHYTAARLRGYPEQTAGARIADMAAHALWSEASIQTTGRDVQPAMKVGQAKLEEISELAHAEGPRTLFYFNGSGDPVYLGHGFQETAADYNTVQWTFGDGPGEVSYQDIGLEYDNETFNDVTASREGGELVNVADTAAIDDKGRRANSEWTDVVLADQADVEHLAADVLASYKEPALRPVTLTVNGAKALAQIQDLQLGHMVRVKRRGVGGVAIDRVVTILGKNVTVDENKHLICTYQLSRGFNASLAQWHLGITGFSELGSTAVLA